MSKEEKIEKMEKEKSDLALWLYGLRMVVGIVITFAGCVDNDREIFAMGVIAFCFGAVEFYLHKLK